MSRKCKKTIIVAAISILSLVVLLTVNVSAQDKPDKNNKLPKDIYLLPFSHFDLAWTGTTPECLSRAYRIFTEAINIAKANLGYHYFIDNMFYLEKYISSHPEKLESLRGLVKKGQIELNPLWIINFQDDNDGELYVRNLLYTKKFIKDTFGIEPTVASMTDLPEWMPQLPQILAKCGINFVVMSRNGPKNDRLFWWRSPDGTKLLTYWMGYGGFMYDPIIEISRRPRAVKNYLEKTLAVFSERCKSRHFLGFCGNDRSLPIAELEKNVSKWNEMSKVKMKISTIKEYYEAVKNTADLPNYSGEVPNTWMGVDAGYAKTFQYAQKATNLLLAAEKLTTISHILGYTKYPAEKIENAWKGLTLACDHGYGGHGYEEGDKRKIVERQKAIFTAEEIIETSLTPITEHIKTDAVDCIPIVVFNTLSWERNEVVNAHFTLQINQSQAGYDDTGRIGGWYKRETYPIKIKDKMVLKDDQGRLIPFQILKRKDVLEYYIIFPAENIPAMGYKTYYIYPAKEEYKKEISLKIEKNSLENEYLKLIIDKEKGSFSLYDKQSNNMVVDSAGFSIISDLTAIRAGRQPEDLSSIPITLAKTILEENGPIRMAVRLIYKCNHPCIRGLELRLSLADGERKLDIESVVDYNMERQKELLGVSLVFPFDIKDAKFHYGVPYGYNESNNLLPDSGFLRENSDPSIMPPHIWKRCRLIQRWIDIKGEDSGFTIASSRNFFILSKRDVRCELVHLNAPAFYNCDEIHLGKVVSNFSIIPHSNTWQEDKTYRFGWELNNPLISYSVNDTVSEKTLPKTFSFLKPLSDSTIVTAIKKEENGDGIILRLFDAEGKQGKIKLEFFQPIANAYESNLIEEKGSKINIDGNEIQANEIKTIKLFLK